MLKVTLKIDGMMCGMCEAHVNDVVRKIVNPKSVKSSAAKNETVIICENKIDEEALKKGIEETGYKVLSINTEEYVKESFFKKLFKK
jgi:copper chaperone CopZ